MVPTQYLVLYTALPTHPPPRLPYSSTSHTRSTHLLAAGVGVLLSVQHQHVDVLTSGQHVVQSGVADLRKGRQGGGREWSTTWVCPQPRGYKEAS